MGKGAAGAVRVRVRAEPRRVRRGRRVRIVVQVRPCAPNRGRRVLLNRGGRRFAAKRLDRGCIARFRPRIRHRSSFRALLLSAGASYARSLRLVIRTRSVLSP